MRLIIMGPPASGKGSQGPFIEAHYHIPHISTGAMFREEIKKGSKLGLELKAILDKGQFVNDELTNEMVKSRLLEDDAKKGFLLDGYPRTVPQALFLDAFLESQGLKIDYAINLYADEDLLIKRVTGRRTCPKCGAIYNIHSDLRPKVENICDICGTKLVKRSDDTEDVIKERLVVYHNKTEPIINYYKDKGIIVDVDGALSAEGTFLQFKQLIGDKE
ncbi:MAG: adenylate kinase [Acholeplasmataceae bacterium]